MVKPGMVKQARLSQAHPLKVAHVTATFPPYQAGAGAVCYYNALHLARRGHAVTVFTRDYGLPPDARTPEPFTVRRLRPLVSVGNAPILPGLLALRGFDLIHLHLPFISGAEMVWLAASLRGLPYLITYHNDLMEDGLRGAIFAAYSRLSIPLVFGRARRLGAVTLDHAQHSRAAQHFARHADKLCEIPNGVDVHHFTPATDGGASRAAVRAASGIPPDAGVVLFVGALDQAHHYRRVDLLLRVIAAMPDKHLLVVGDGDKRADYERLAAELGLSGRAHFLGKHPHADLPPIFTAADVLVLPSEHQESFGMVLIEALACGIPVIASRLPGVRSVVCEGEDALLVEPGNPDDLRARLEWLFADESRRRAMGAQGRARVVETYAWEAVVTRLEALYQEVVSEPR